MFCAFLRHQRYHLFGLQREGHDHFTGDGSQREGHDHFVGEASPEEHNNHMGYAGDSISSSPQNNSISSRLISRQ